MPAPPPRRIVQALLGTPKGGRLPTGLLGSQGSMSNYTPTARERLTALIAKGIFSDSREGFRKAGKVTDVAEMSPVGLLTGMYDAGRAAGGGNIMQAGLIGGMAALPLPPALKKGIRALPEIRPSTDDVYQTLSANFMHGDVVGNKTLPISKVFGSGTAETADQLKRVDELAAKIGSPEGYISRLIVDTDGNVVEGQHRLEALKKLGMDRVPVTVIRDKAKNIDTAKIEAAIRASQKTHPDHVNQIVSQILDMVSEAGSPQKALTEFVFPRNFDAQFRAGLEAMK